MTQTPPYQVTDPATGEVTETFPFATDAEVAEALAAATAAFSAWRLRTVAERAAIVKRIAELFTERAADLAALITKEMGKRPAQAVGEAEFCTDIFNYYADNGPGLIADKPLPGHDTARVEYRPVGPVHRSRLDEYGRAHIVAGADIGDQFVQQIALIGNTLGAKIPKVVMRIADRQFRLQGRFLGQRQPVVSSIGHSGSS